MIFEANELNGNGSNAEEEVKFILVTSKAKPKRRPSAPAHIGARRSIHSKRLTLPWLFSSASRKNSVNEEISEQAETPEKEPLNTVADTVETVDTVESNTISDVNPSASVHAANGNACSGASIENDTIRQFFHDTNTVRTLDTVDTAVIHEGKIHCNGVGKRLMSIPDVLLNAKKAQAAHRSASLASVPSYRNRLTKLNRQWSQEQTLPVQPTSPINSHPVPVRAISNPKKHSVSFDQTSLRPCHPIDLEGLQETAV